MEQGAKGRAVSTWAWVRVWPGLLDVSIGALTKIKEAQRNLRHSRQQIEGLKEELDQPRDVYQWPNNVAVCVCLCECV